MTPSALQDILNGNFLTKEWFRKQRRLLILISVLIFMYVYSGFAAQAQHRRLTDIKQELKDAEYTLSTKQAELIKLTRQSSLSEELRQRASNIQENQEPIIRLR